MTQTNVESPSLTLTHHADAPIDRVFRAFSDAADLQIWFGHEGFTKEAVQMEARVGGDYRISMRSPDGEVYTVKGVVQQHMPMKDKSGEAAKEHEGMPEIMKMRVEYRLTAGGSAIQETFNAGSPMEMVSMYHDRDGSLSMTHYCMLGNQPRMDLNASSPGKMSFNFAEENELDPATGMHMHSMNLSIIDADNMTQRWTM